MARFLFPNDRMAYVVAPTGGGLFSAVNQTVQVYLDADGAHLAQDLLTYPDQQVNSTGQLIVDDNSEIPLFWGPDGLTTLYLKPSHQGELYPTYANIDARITALEEGSGLSPSDLGETFVQSTPSTTWTIVHSLPFQPNVTITDSGGNTVEGTVLYVDNHTVQVSFSAAFGGKAYLS